jgi:glycosyltransferase involved in cell wall biosynthesis
VPKISGIVITLNEENHIGACLESLIWVDEIVVMDSGSLDKTREIAQTFTPHVYETTWKGFGETKNLALSRVTGEWVLWVDADERVTPGLVQEIRTRLEVDAGRFAGYEIPRLAFFLGHPIHHSGWYPGYVLRLFKKEAGHFTVQPVHEGVTLRGKIGRLKGDLLHYTDPTLEHYIDKMNRYTTLAAEDLYQKGRRVRLFDLLIRPKEVFCKMYLLNSGFLDGICGFLIALLSAYHVFTKYAKLWKRQTCHKA